ncbi:MAG: ChaN family lipoprotein [Candidatus Aminicenantes bacterium]|nr:ChaN family lipoprotein [Candidatus Aminicenantes bacterium]
MKNKHAAAVLSLIIFLATAVRGADDSALDALPIGASPQRLAMAVLEAGKAMDTALGRETDIPALARRFRDRDVFVIGEYHDSYACHVWQKDFLEALAGEHPRLVVGFEFFTRDDDPALALYLQGGIDEAELLRRTGWYARGSLNFGYTRLVLETVKRLGLKAVGLNVPRELVRRVARTGFAGLSAAEKELFPGAERSHHEHEYFIRRTFSAFAVQVPLWFRGIYGAQKCWDTVMAESMRRALARPGFRGFKGVIIAGSAHVAYGLGIPWRYRIRERRARIVTFVPVTVSAKRKIAAEEENPMLKALAGQLPPAALFSRGLADAVFAVAAEERPFFADAGFAGKMNAAGLYEVERVDKDSPAEKAGLKNGDVILAVDGVPLTSLEGLRILLAQKSWGDKLELNVRKKMALDKSIRLPNDY